MFAIIKSGGKQYKVQEGDLLEVEKIGTENGQRVIFDQVLLIDDDEKTLVGTPFLENAGVRAEVIENFKDRKIIVFKKKRRKQFKRKRGHRQELTLVRIDQIVPDLKAAPKEEKAKVEKKKAVPREKPKLKKAKPQKVKKEKPRIAKEKKPAGKVSKAKQRPKASAQAKKARSAKE